MKIESDKLALKFGTEAEALRVHGGRARPFFDAGQIMSHNISRVKEPKKEMSFRVKHNFAVLVSNQVVAILFWLLAAYMPFYY